MAGGSFINKMMPFLSHHPAALYSQTGLKIAFDSFTFTIEDYNPIKQMPYLIVNQIRVAVSTRHTLER